MEDIFLRVSHVTKRYDAHTALSDVSADVPRGKVFGLLGPNGAGKSTLIRIVNRLTLPDSGTVTFDGHPLCAADTANIGYLPEERGLYRKMKAGEQAVYLARLRGLGEREARTRMKAWFDKLGLTQWWDKRLDELSKGMQQKVQFAITVAHEPPLLIFDEPFSGFDPVNAEMLKREILALRDKGHTVIFSTHNMSSVEDVCDEIALINKSRVALAGSVADIKSRFRTGLHEVTATGAEVTPVEGLFAIEAHTERAGLHTYTLRKDAAATGSQLAACLAAQTEIRSFAETLPTMQEIFIKTVTEAAEPEN